MRWGDFKGSRTTGCCNCWLRESSSHWGVVGRVAEGKGLGSQKGSCSFPFSFFFSFLFFSSPFLAVNAVGNTLRAKVENKISSFQNLIALSLKSGHKWVVRGVRGTTLFLFMEPHASSHFTTWRKKKKKKHPQSSLLCTNLALNNNDLLQQWMTV